MTSEPVACALYLPVLYGVCSQTLRKKWCVERRRHRGPSVYELDRQREGRIIAAVVMLDHVYLDIEMSPIHTMIKAGSRPLDEGYGTPAAFEVALLIEPVAWRGGLTKNVSVGIVKEPIESDVITPRYREVCNSAGGASCGPA